MKRILFVLAALFLVSTMLLARNDNVNSSEEQQAVAALPRNNSTTPEGWSDDLDAALKLAREQKKFVLVLFTGSDWCGWCKKLKADTLMQSEFLDFSSKHLIKVYIDLPREGLTDEQKMKNQQIMNSVCGDRAGFPTTVLMSKNGKTIGSISGYLAEKEYLTKIKKIIKKHKNGTLK